MTQLVQSPAMISLAKEMGVDIDSSVTFNPTTALQKVAAQLQGAQVTFSGEDAEFGGIFTKIFKKPKAKLAAKLSAKATTTAGKTAAANLRTAPMKVDVKATAKGLARAATTVGKVAAVATFIVPGVGPLVGGSALAAAAAADKLLGDPKVKNAAQLVSNTKALAAIGHQPAQRGAAALAAVAQMRLVKGAKPGQAVIPPRPVVASHYVQEVPRAHVNTLAVKAVAAAPKKSFWQRVKEWFT